MDRRIRPQIRTKRIRHLRLISTHKRYDSIWSDTAQKD